MILNSQPKYLCFNFKSIILQGAPYSSICVKIGQVHLYNNCLFQISNVSNIPQTLKV